MYKRWGAKKILLFFITLLILIISPREARANELIEPKILENKSNAVVGWKQYLLVACDGKNKIIMKDQCDECPMISLLDGDSYTTVLPGSESSAKPVKIVEYTKFGLAEFTDKGITITDSFNKQVFLSYPNQTQFTGEENASFYRFIKTATDGEDIFFVLEGNLYQLSTRDKSFTYLTKLKNFRNDTVDISINRYPAGEYVLISISENYGEPHLGFQGHSILTKKDRLVHYWLNRSYGGDRVLPAYLGENQIVAAQDEQLTVYSMPSLQPRRYPINTKEPGVIYANHAYAVINSNEECILEILDLKTGEVIRPYKILYSDDQKKIVEENEDIFRQGDSLQFVSLTGDEFVFELKNAYRFAPPADNVYDHAGAPVNRSNLNFKTREFGWESIEKTTDNTEKNPLINAQGLNMQLTYSPRINPGDSNVIEVCLPEQVLQLLL